MIKKAIIFLVLTVLVGGGFVFGANYLLNQQGQPQVTAASMIDVVKPEQKFRKVVVASKPLSFGTILESGNLTEISWPQNALPQGAYGSIEEMLKDGSRVALRPIEINEPVLSSKITGSNEKASLSQVIAEGNRAVTIRVNDVAGVAGFILPGDRVDVVLTRSVTIQTGIDGDRRRNKKSSIADLLLQGVRVLTVDQFADERSDQPQVAKAVTLELNSIDAQKVALASTVGDLSLLLRSAGDQSVDEPKTIKLSDLGSFVPPQPVKANSLVPAPSAIKNVSMVVVRRPKATQEYEVPNQ